MATKTLKQKLLEVSKSIKYLEKDKENKMQHYSYLSEAKIKEVFKKQFEENGVLFNYSTDEVREYEISSTSRGTKQFCTIAKGTYRFMDVDSDQEIIGTWHGSGTDTGDKGLYKAITGGIKYVINTNFLTPTGDDPENDDNDKGNGSGNGKSKNTTPRPKNGTSKESTTDNESGNDDRSDDKKVSDLLTLAFTNDTTRKAFVRDFKGSREKMIETLKSRIDKEVA